MTKRLLWIGVLVFTCLASSTRAGEVLELANVRILSMTGDAPFVGNVRIRDGKIERVYKGLSQRSDSIDLSGRTLLPGLIDSHVHLQTVPGEAYRGDSKVLKRELREQHLRAYVASGVTTVLDAGISANVLRELKGYLADGGPGPRLLALGPVFFTSNGYLDSDLMVTSSKPVQSEQDVEDLFREYGGISELVGVKVPIEYAFAPVHLWPIHSPEMRKTITQASEMHGRPIYVHATSEEEQTIGIQMGARALVHSGFWDESPSPEFLDLINERGTYVISTLSGMLDLKLVEYEQTRLDDPLYRLTVPPIELSTARNQDAWAWSTKQIGRAMKPGWLPNFISDFVSPIMMREAAIREWLASASSAIKQMHDRGVPIVVGTDAGNFPVILNFFHGPSTIRELELLKAAGLSSIDVLAAATTTPARMLGVEATLGTIEEGKTADLIVVSGDPLTDISVLRRLDWVIRDGEMRTPAEWVEIGQ